MPRFEIVAHVTRELTCETAEEAAVIVRRQIQSAAGPADGLLHLAVWREDPGSATSPLPASLRQQLRDFFTAVERCAGAAEAAFRERVAAILTSPDADNGDAGDRGPSGAPRPAPSVITKEMSR